MGEMGERKSSQPITEMGKEKFDHLLAYIYVSRKGITWRELKELIPALTDEDIKLAVRETIECLKVDSSRAALHKNLATLIEKHEPTN